MKQKEKLIEILAKAVKRGLKTLPDSVCYSHHFYYYWTDKEKEEVKKARRQLEKTLKIYEALKYATKTD